MATAERENAQESAKVRKARDKLLRQLKKEEEFFTPKAMEDTVEKIHKWIADNAKHRIKIKKKSLNLFNQNKEAAAISKKVEQIAENLKNGSHGMFS